MLALRILYEGRSGAGPSFRSALFGLCQQPTPDFACAEWPSDLPVEWRDPTRRKAADYVAGGAGRQRLQNPVRR